MNITPVALGTRSLTAALAGAPAPAYGQVITLAFATGAGADRLALDAAGAILKAHFTPYDYDGLAGLGGVFAAQLTAGEPADTVIVTLPAPRYILQVNLAGGVAASGDQVELYRVDHGAAAGRPAAVAGNGEAFDADFVEQTFALRLKRPDGGDGSYLPLAPGSVAHLYLRSYPTTPRLGLPDPAQPGRSVFFWQQAGEAIPALSARDSGRIGLEKGRLDGVAGRDLPLRAAPAPLAAPVSAAAASKFTGGHSHVQHVIRGRKPGVRLPGSAAAGQAGAGPALAAALQRLLDRRTAPLPTAGLSFDLTVASDTPCVFTLDTLALPYHLHRTTFAVDTAHPDGTAKQVLRFAGDRVAGQAVNLALPAAARATAATLKVGQRLRPGGPAAGGEAVDTALAGADGVNVGGDAWVAQSFTPPAALNATGLALDLLPLAAGTTLKVEVHADWQGRPAGQALAGGSVKLAAVGERAWAIVRFAGVAVLPSQPHWLLLRTTGGQAVWLAARAATAARIQVLDQPAAGAPFAVASAIAGLAGHYRLLSGQDDAAPSLTLSLGGLPLGPAVADGENLTFGLAPALNTYLTANPAAGLVTIPLTFTSAAGGLVTVYPPDIVYDVLS